ncbi:hypothetical protein [Microbacterium sp. SORGH_AS_0862]|uniref:hypothetical protein n=1 Tax=Microbacterium sp. SORGH_AS_0862 TaxID=3041789 RepID=UPI00278E1BEA|nr:hypothetical protein [Microbacterium sp. SORGH_AS_0862]MDQ1205026.1 hypothetical protein [Microbacterium sp. SORGH_AS_0862]
MPDLSLQFGVYQPNGPRIATLPYPLAASLSDVLNDLGSGSIDYLATVQHASKLEGLCEVSAEIAVAGGEWREFGARWLRLKRGASFIEETRTRRYTLHSYGFQLGKVRMLREELLNENGERIMADSTVGAVVKTLIDEAKSRGNISGLTYSFTAGQDSAGAAWPAIPPQAIRFGDDLLSLLRTMSENGLVDWVIVGRELKLYKADTFGVTRNVTLRNGIDLMEAPDDEDATEMAGRVGVLGDDGRTYEHVSPTVGPWGLWEELVNASGVKDIGALQYIGEVEQSRRDAPRVQMTRGLRLAGVDYLPGVHYGVGDTITAPNDRGDDAQLRVRQITLGLAQNGVTGNLVLGDRFLERDVRTRRSVSGLLGTAAASAGGAGTPTPAGDDKRKPAKPTGLVVSTVHRFTPAGDTFAIVDAQFVPVATGEDGQPLSISRHEMYSRPNIAGDPWVKLTDSVQGTNRLTYSPLPAGDDWQFKLRAVSAQGVVGDFTDPVTITLADDTEPPPKPATPTASSRLGQVSVLWSGRDAAGNPQPVDFSHAEVWLSSTLAGSGSPVGTILAGGDTFYAPEQPYGEERWFWLVSVDRAGNRSEPSEKVAVTTQPLVDTDVIGEVVAGANIVSGSINAADKIIGNTITGELIQALTIEGGHLKGNTITGDKIQAGSIDSRVIKAGSITADKVVIGNENNLVPDAIFLSGIGDDAGWSLATTGWDAGMWSVQDIGGGWQRAIRFQGTSSGGYAGVGSKQVPIRGGLQVTFSVGMHRQSWSGGLPFARAQFSDITGATVGYWDFTHNESGSWVSYSTNGAVPADAAFVRVLFYINPGGSGTAFFGVPTIRSRVDGALIVDGAIDGKTITGATVRTAASGARVEMTPQGIRQYDAGGNVLTQIGHGTATGMQIRDPASGQQVSLAAMAFGAQGVTRTDQALTPWPPTDDGSWGPWTNEVIGTYSSPTGRFLLLFSASIYDPLANYQQTRDLAVQINALDSGGTILASTPIMITYGKQLAGGQAFMSLSPNTPYTFRWAWSGNRFVGGYAAHLGTRTLAVLPT